MTKNIDLAKLVQEKGIHVTKYDSWNFHKDLAEMEERLEQLEGESKYFDKEVDIYHERGFVAADDSWIIQMHWLRANRTFWSVPKLIAKVENKIQFELAQDEFWEEESAYIHLLFSHIFHPIKLLHLIICSFLIG